MVIEGFDKDKVEAYLEEKGVLDTSEFGLRFCYVCFDL